MQKVMERLDRQDEMLLSMQPSGKAPNPMNGIRLFDNQDLCMLLQISKRYPVNATAASARCLTRRSAKRPITARRTC